MPASPRGRPRDPAVDAAIRDAARGLLLDVGYAAFTFDALAARAGVSRPTVYRRFPTKAAVVFEAVFLGGAAGRTRGHVDTGRLPDDLAHAVAAVTASFATPEATAALPGLTADLAANPQLADALRARVVAPAYDLIRAVLERARDRGEVRPDLDLTLIVDVFAGTAFSRAMFLGRPVDAGFTRQLVDVVVAGVRPR